jgi:hypothetical protein
VDQGLHPGNDIWANDFAVQANTEGRGYLYQTWQDAEGWHVEPHDAGSPQANEDLAGFGNSEVAWLGGK